MNTVDMQDTVMYKKQHFCT